MIEFLVKMVLMGRVAVDQILEKYVEEVRAALGGINPPWLPGVSIGVPIDQAVKGGVKIP